MDNNKLVKSNNKKYKLLGLALFLLVFDRMWGFVFKYTIYKSNTMVYVSFIVLLILFLWIFLKYRMGKWVSLNFIWAPYLLLTMGGYFFRFSLENLTYWFICFVMIMTASVVPLLKLIPSKFIFLSGIFAAIGIMVQLFFPSFYHSKISGIFLSDIIGNWEDSYGFAGFTYQLGATASILIYSEVFFLYLSDKIQVKWFQHKFIYVFFVIFLIICVFLTGKRMLSAIALAIPFIVYYVSRRMGIKKICFLFLFTFVALGCYEYFVNHLSEFSDNIFLRRFVESYIDANMGEDITSSRTYLYELAWKAFYDSPLTGIGVGQFIHYTGAYTDVHNTYLQVLCEQGILGSICYILPIIYCLFYTWKLFYKVKEEDVNCSYIKLSLAIQLFYVLYCMTGNENVGIGFVMYFLSIAILISLNNEVNINNLNRYENCNMCS